MEGVPGMGPTLLAEVFLRDGPGPVSRLAVSLMLWKKPDYMT
jgi:hypothetical protein